MNESRAVTTDPRVSLTALQAVFDAMHSAVGILDPQGRLLYLNPPFAALAGSEPHEAVGKSPGDIFDETSAAAAMHCLHLALETGERAQGNGTLGHMVAVPVADEGGAVSAAIFVVGGAAGEMLRACELAESEQRFRDFAEASADWLWEMDADLRFTYMSDNVERIVGVPPEWHYGKTRRDLLGDEYDHDAWDDHLARLERHEPFRDFVFQRVGEGIEPRWLSSSGIPRFGEGGKFLGYRGVGRDITAQRNQQEELRTREEQLRLLTDSLPVQIVYIDAEGCYQLVNKTCEEWFGRPREQILGHSVSEFFPEYEEELAGCAERVLAGEHVVFERLQAYPDGETREVRLIYAPRNDTEGNVDGYFVLAEDISASKAVEEQLRQAQKMEAVGQLTGGVAHDFNNLLTAIIGNLEMLRGGDLKEGDRTLMVEQALTAADRGADLVRHLLAFSRQQSLEPELIDLNRMIEDTVRLFRRTLGEDIEIRTSFAPDIGKVIVDPSQLQTAMLNLALNARDAMPNGGLMTLETTAAHLAPGMPGFDRGVESGDYVGIAITDTGAGISPNVLGRVFDPFFTTKESGRGSGLGLSMVYGFVRQSRGQVTIQSDPGAGTTVKIYLPQASEAQMAQQEAESETDLSLAGNAHVVIVEDEQLVRDYVATALQTLGYRVSVFADGPEAVSSLDRLDKVDLLLSDVVLPKGMNGPDVAEKVLARFPDIQVLFMSGYSEETIVAQWRMREGVHLLSKPFTPAQLASRIVELLGA